MLAYTTYSEAGGVAKTTTAANLAVAHARAGLDVLVVPLDPQDGNLSHLLGVDDDRADPSVDNIVRHMVNRPKGPFEELIVTAESGVDIIPEHNMLSDLADNLRREKEQAEAMGESFGVNTRLLSVLRDAGVHETYDVLICDPPATEGRHLYNAITATHSLVIPVEPSAKGEASVKGLESLVAGIEDTLDIDVGVLAAVPVKWSNTNEAQRVLDELEYSTPEVFRSRESLMNGCWRQQCSAFTYVSEHRDRTRDHELDTLERYDRLARHLEQQAGVEAPAPPEPGALEPEVTA